MTFLEILRAVFVFIFMIFIPGFTFLRMIFPRRGELGGDYEDLYQFTLSLLISVLILILLGFSLDALSDVADTGLVRPKYLLGGLGLLSLIFFAIGWWRGAYPIMGYIHPALARHPQPLVLGIDIPKKKQNVLAEMDSLTLQIRDVRRDISGCERKISFTKGAERIRYKEKRKELNDELIGLSNRFRGLEKDQEV